MTKFMVFYVDHKNNGIVYLKYDQDSCQLYARKQVTDPWIHYMDLSEIAKQNDIKSLASISQCIDSCIDVNDITQKLNRASLADQKQLVQAKMDMFVRIKSEYMGNASIAT